VDLIPFTYLKIQKLTRWFYSLDSVLLKVSFLRVLFLGPKGLPNAIDNLQPGEARVSG